MRFLSPQWPQTSPLQRLPHIQWDRQPPTYRAAKPAIIDAALQRSQQRPSGNWYVFAASSSVRADRPFGATIGGVEIVAWRDEQHRLRVGPGACPHLGAPLQTASVECGALICRWHGLRLANRRTLGWEPLPSYDDGVLAWVRLDEIGGEPPLERPVLPERADDAGMHAVARLVGVCEPSDIIANRLDPWHGAWFHPYSFTLLDVVAAPPAGPIPEPEDRFLVTVTFRVTSRLGVPVEAEFSSPEPRTIVMRILSGEGAGSIVETHATPLGPGTDGRPRTAVIEAVVAHSQRPGFARVRRIAPPLRALMRHAATRLWRDDLAYAERRYFLRTQTRHPTVAAEDGRSELPPQH